MMDQEKDTHLYICGSPRRHGRCAELIERLAKGDDDATVLYVGDLDIAGCNGCEACRAFVPQIACVHDDDMVKVHALMAEARCLTVVAPLYFAGPPSQLKALLDRLQPHYWANTRRAPKRPAYLHVLGEGGDPHGSDALITIARSALAVAGFSLEEVDVRVGCHA